jgi:hypothetical protein
MVAGPRCASPSPRVDACGARRGEPSLPRLGERLEGEREVELLCLSFLRRWRRWQHRSEGSNRCLKISADHIPIARDGSEVCLGGATADVVFVEGGAQVKSPCSAEEEPWAREEEVAAHGLRLPRLTAKSKLFGDALKTPGFFRKPLSLRPLWTTLPREHTASSPPRTLPVTTVSSVAAPSPRRSAPASRDARTSDLHLKPCKGLATVSARNRTSRCVPTRPCRSWRRGGDSNPR